MALHRSPSTLTLATAWCDQLSQYCTGLHKSCTFLHAAVQREPERESKGDKSDIFLEDLNDSVSSALAELQHLEERTTDTLSFAELLVHCGALYESNEDGIRKLELQLQQYGYTPVEVSKCTSKDIVEDPLHKDVEIDSQNRVGETSPPRSEATLSLTDDREASVVTPMAQSHQIRIDKKDVDYSPLFGDLEDLGNLESLGISATSLTALAGQDEPGQGCGSDLPLQHTLTFAESPARDDSKISSKWRMAEEEDNLKTKYGNDWNSELELELSPPPSVQTTKFESTYGNGDRHLGPDITGNSGSDYGFGTTISGATSTTSERRSFTSHLSGSSSDFESCISLDYTMMLISRVQVVETGTNGFISQLRLVLYTLFNKPRNPPGRAWISHLNDPHVSRDSDVSVQRLESTKVALLDEVTSAQYDSSPSFLKDQVSLQELNSVVTKINELIRQRSVGGHHASQLVLDQADVQALGLGSKAKACFLLLGKADKLVTQISNGVAVYRIRA